jgi:hypothetical protein
MPQKCHLIFGYELMSGSKQDLIRMVASPLGARICLQRNRDGGPL